MIEHLPVAICFSRSVLVPYVLALSCSLVPLCVFGQSNQSQVKQKIPRVWYLQAHVGSSTKFEDLLGLLREANVQVAGGPDETGALRLAVDIKGCKQSRAVLEKSSAIDRVQDAVEQPAEGLLSRDYCSLRADNN